MNVGMYVRCSTNDQSTELQIRELHEYARRRNWESVAIYEDKGATGANTNRPEFQRMLADSRARKLDVVMVWRLDRAARSLRDLVLTLQEFADLGVDFVSLKDSIDWSTSSGRLFLHILAAFSEFELSVIRSRVKSGLANARAKGRRLGRPPQVDVIKVMKFREAGYSLGEIAKKLGCSKSAVHKTLLKFRTQKRSTNPQITGEDK